MSKKGKVNKKIVEDLMTKIVEQDFVPVKKQTLTEVLFILSNALESAKKRPAAKKFAKKMEAICNELRDGITLSNGMQIDKSNGDISPLKTV